MQIIKGVLTLLAVAGLTSAAAAGPSFDCKQSNSATEWAICANSKLGDLDAKMSRSYFNLINDASGEARHWAKQSQRDFLSQRDRCGARAACLQNVYSTRIEELTSYWDR